MAKVKKYQGGGPVKISKGVKSETSGTVKSKGFGSSGPSKKDILPNAKPNSGKLTPIPSAKPGGSKKVLLKKGGKVVSKKK